MKCALIVLSLAVAAQASVLPLGPWGYPGVLGWPYSVGAPGIVQYSTLPVGHVVQGVPGITISKQVPAAVQVLAGPSPVVTKVVSAHGPVVVAGAPSATYTSATRGAVHQAPLEGHAVSQTSLNLAPAPGTL